VGVEAAAARGIGRTVATGVAAGTIITATGGSATSTGIDAMVRIGLG
jgi:hypothetical protein